MDFHGHPEGGSVASFSLTHPPSCLHLRCCHAITVNTMRTVFLSHASFSLSLILLQELNGVNYLELYRVADLFHLPALEEAVVGFLVEHLSELRQNRQDEALQLPYRLLREVLKSDRLTSLSEEEIWKVVSE